ncbi:type IV secretion system protein VirB3 [Sphingobium fuliginis]|uniref:Type VI secretion protein n=1 Tax=Sphingobium fuliginis ATCC 27551 TaxID=1208342 RepID=A0A5B8CC60_SPHSA|nr:type IV secretion system protein VirB3 [Sphingobium fuliginis]QDC36365.1 type VI secretion protein [Sphingobium fuliginis ATCC 27551]
MQGIERDRVFTALTRPQMFAGVTYSYFVANAILATELFLIFRNAWALGLALLVHGLGMVLCVREPRFFDLWLTKLGRCPRVRNYRIWQCNSYRP